MVQLYCLSVLFRSCHNRECINHHLNAAEVFLVKICVAWLQPIQVSQKFSQKMEAAYSVLAQRYLVAWNNHTLKWMTTSFVLLAWQQKYTEYLLYHSWMLHIPTTAQSHCWHPKILGYIYIYIFLLFSPDTNSNRRVSSGREEKL